MKIFNKFTALVLCLIMILSIGTVLVSAEPLLGATSKIGKDEIILDKQYDPNSKTLKLESFVTGETVTTETTMVVPCDIILVLDCSSSMNQNMSGGTSTSTSNPSKLTVLKRALNNFIDDVHTNAINKGANHRLAIVKFAASASLISTTNVVAGTSARTADYQSALVEIDNKGTLNSLFSSTTLNARVTTPDEHGTRPDLGLELAEKIVDNRTETTFPIVDEEGKPVLDEQDKPKTAARKVVVIVFTDGEPYNSSVSGGQSNDGYTMQNITPANGAIKVSNSLKKKDAVMYTLAVVAGCSPEGSADFTISENRGTTIYSSKTLTSNAFFHFLSSNDNQTDKDTLEAKVSSWSTSTNSKTARIDEETLNKGFYLTADDEATLQNMFSTVNNKTITGGTTLSLGTTTVIVDELNQYFKLPDNAKPEDIKVHTEQFNGIDDKGNFLWINNNDYGVYKAKIKEDNPKWIEVEGFDFKAYYVDVTGTVKTGRKVVVEIPIVFDDLSSLPAGTNTLDTNTPNSGLWVNGEQIAKYPVPQMDVKVELGKVTIKKSINGTLKDPNQVFIFRIQAKNEVEGYGLVDIEVAVHGASETPLINIPVGEYYVWEDEDWAWGFDCPEKRTFEVKKYIEERPEETKTVIEFKNTPKDDVTWINQEALPVKNVFSGKKAAN